MAETQKLDLYKEHKHQYAAPKKPVLVKVGRARYLTISGQGEPGSEAFIAAVGGMYAVAFTIKMTSKFAGRDYKVCHLEGLWWAQGRDEGEPFVDVPKARWCWKLLIRVPDFITAAELKKARQTLLEKGKAPEAQAVELESITEGQCVQMLHVGPYAAEGETIAAMEELATANGLAFAGRHHEIYLSDPRRVPPERLKTILRHPVRRA